MKIYYITLVHMDVFGSFERMGLESVLSSTRRKSKSFRLFGLQFVILESC